MEIRLRINGQVLTDAQFRALHPETSFPPTLTGEMIDALDADVVIAVPPPQAEPGHRAVRDGVEQDANGEWRQKWRSEAIDDADKARGRAEIWEAIKAERTRRQFGGVHVNGHWFQTDVDARIKFLALKDKARDALQSGAVPGTLLYQLGKPIQWKSYTNEFVPMSVALAIELVAATSDLDAAAFTNAEVHRQALLRSNDPAAYDFSSGWPDIYPG